MCRRFVVGHHTCGFGLSVCEEGAGALESHPDTCSERVMCSLCICVSVLCSGWGLLKTPGSQETAVLSRGGLLSHCYCFPFLFFLSVPQHIHPPEPLYTLILCNAHASRGISEDSLRKTAHLGCVWVGAFSKGLSLRFCGRDPSALTTHHLWIRPLWTRMY